ncbi:hypothetical protein CDO52_15790 [Nocardiopsis gilva YIM 90087]|uniref:Transposase IS66 central domain-containing protein n=1 Tax=Nocardiopsis gilva YIM 90087 TaxID=1235441 RepID=A0A223S7F5_9ACTN|nr:transposase [Nocardiopsis gilva]ASU84057.1 hypothetical protein CDO52_15790 [Nocardiopsis gilva YIM 90087]
MEFDPAHADWSAHMKDVLIAARDRAQGRTALTGAELAEVHRRYARIIAFAKAGQPHALIRRLDGRREDYLRFAADFAVPFTSNGAERDLRMVKPQVKVSGAWRTLTGARYSCRIRSFIYTVRKQGHTVLAKLTELFAGNVW